MIIPDEVRKGIAFIGYEGAERPIWCGTGFFVSRPWQTIPEARFVYLVTARHLIDRIAHKSKEIWVRLDLRQGGVDILRTSPSDWRPHPDSTVDLYAYRCDGVMAELFDIRHAPLPLMAATEQNLATRLTALGPGDEVFVIGLFVNRAGVERNIPIVRVGVLAAMPEEKVKWRGQEIDAYLVETHSIGGHSGSPVFVHYGSSMPRRMAGAGSQGISVMFFLLGVLRGHYDDEDEAINQGIAVVTPVEKVIELLEVFEEEDRAEEAEEAKKVEASQVEDSDVSEGPFERFVSGIFRVPKAAIQEAEVNRLKRPSPKRGRPTL